MLTKQIKGYNSCMNNEEKKAVLNKFLEKIHEDGKPGVVLFYSDDCPPCDAFKPVFKKLEMGFSGDINFHSVNLKDEPVVSEKLKIRSMPTVIFLKNGEEACSRVSGYIEPMDVKEKLENVLGGTCPKGSREKITADVAIIGAGPAGLSAALYTARAKLYTVIIDRAMPGGQVATTFTIENYAGTDGPITGPELVENMVGQVETLGAELIELQEITKVDFSGKLKHISSEATDYYVKAVIIATGAQPRLLPVEKEEEYRGRGLHYCATCDGALYQDAEILVVGGGNSGVEEAHNLTKFAKKVTLITRKDHLTATQAGQKAFFANPKTDVIWNTEVEELKGNVFLDKVLLKNIKTGKTKEFKADGIFTFIGMIPRTEIFKGHVKIDENGYIITDDNMETDIPGVYACGDVRKKYVRQIANAVGDGAVAAIFAEKFISSEDE